MFKFQKDDQVLVTAGKDKGKHGKILQVYPQSHRVQIQGVNLYKKHRRATLRQPAEIITITRPLPTGNVALVCPKCHQHTRVGFQVDKDKTKHRLCRKCHSLIDTSLTTKTTTKKSPTSNTKTPAKKVISNKKPATQKTQK